MSRKHVYVLLGVLGALVALYLGLRLRGPGGGLAASDEALGLSGLATERVDSVVFARPDDTLRLARGDVGWRVGRWPADSARIEELWRAAREAQAAELVARSPANHPRLGVTDSAATRVAFFAGGKAAAKLLVGASGPSWPSAYVRRPDAPEVYLLRGDLANLVRRAANEWRTSRIASFDPVRADRVILRRGRDSVTLERADTLWTVAAGKAAPAAADTAAVRRAVETLSRLSSAGFAPDSVADALSFERPTARVTVLDGAGATLADLLLLEGEAGSYYIRRADRADVWDLSRFTVEDFLRKAEEFRRREAS